MDRPVLGVLGGVGPLATAYFMELVIKKTPVTRDQDNIPMIVFNDPQIPDRTAHILDASQPDPFPEMKRVVHWLERAGADYIAIPCNTAHYFYDDIAAEASVPVLNIMHETTNQIVHTVGPGATIGILATDGTLAAGVFHAYLEKAGMRAVQPTEREQAEVVMPLIYGCIKQNLPYDAEPLLGVAERMHLAGCDMVIVGCTELSVVYQDLPERPGYLIDSMDVLAERCVDFYYEARAHDAKRGAKTSRTPPPGAVPL